MTTLQWDIIFIPQMVVLVEMHPSIAFPATTNELKVSTPASAGSSDFGRPSHARVQ